MPGYDSLGSVNWDTIYSSFHHPSDISDKITVDLRIKVGDTILKDFLKQ